MAPPKSKVWKFFVKLNEKEVSCKLCFKKILSSGNTSNMLKHMKKHPSSLSADSATSIPKEKSTPSTSSGSGTSYTIDMSHPQPSTSKEKGKVLIQGVVAVSPMGEETDDPGVKYSETVAKTETEYRKYQPSIIKAFQNVGTYDEGGHRYAAINNSILYFICKDKRPFHVVNGKGFKRMIKELAPSYKIPGVKKLKSLLDDKYEALHHVYLEKFKTVSHFSVTCDVWSEMMTTTSYLGVTVHYLQGTSMESVLIGVKELVERHTGAHLSAVLREFLDEWGIEMDKVLAVITDNGSNITSAVAQTEGLGKSKHLPCFAHTINLVAESVTGNADVSPLITKVRDIMKWVKRSVIASDKLRNVQRGAGVMEGNIKKLILDVKTRWNSVFYMLRRFLELSDIINPILLKDAEAPPAIPAGEIEIIKQLCEILRSLEYVTTEASGEQYTTISIIIPMIYCCTKQIESIEPINDIIRGCKISLLSEIKRRFGQIEMNSVIANATLLDPRFKNLNFQDANACGKAINNIEKLLERMESEAASGSNDDDSEPQSAQSDAQSYDFWSYHKQMVHGKERKSDRKMSKSAISEEVRLYFKNPVSPLKTQPLQVWEDMKQIFPNLYKLARQHFVIVATSVPAERLFSKAGATMARDRNRLSGKRLTKILFLGDCSDEDWFN